MPMLQQPADLSDSHHWLAHVHPGCLQAKVAAVGDLQSLLHQHTHLTLADLEAHCDKLMLMLLEHTGEPQCQSASSSRHGCWLYRLDTGLLASGILTQACASTCQARVVTLSACCHGDSAAVELGLPCLGHT